MQNISATATTIIKVNKLSKRLPSPEGELTLLDDINFNICRAEAVAIVGASGSGKSTLLGLLAGLDNPSAGDIEIDGISICALDEDGRAALRAQSIGFVFQTFHLLPNLTALENVMLPLELAYKATARADAIAILDRVGLSQRLQHYPRQMSGGEQQRVAIARAFVVHPKILFADEPTGSLDRGTGEKVVDLLFQLNKEMQATLVLVTHDEKLAARCDRQLIIDAGRLIKS